MSGLTKKSINADTLGIKELLVLMAWVVESGYLSHQDVIELIDERLSDDFIKHPVLITLSLAMNQEDFLGVIGGYFGWDDPLYASVWESSCAPKEMPLSFDEVLLGFMTLAYQEDKIKCDSYQERVLDLFDVQAMAFSIEEVGEFFESQLLGRDGWDGCGNACAITILFLRCRQTASGYLDELYRWCKIGAVLR